MIVRIRDLRGGAETCVKRQQKCLRGGEWLLICRIQLETQFFLGIFSFYIGRQLRFLEGGALAPPPIPYTRPCQLYIAQYTIYQGDIE